MYKYHEKVDRNDVDYTLDNNVNTDVLALSNYISLEDEISSDMISDELQDCYTKYFYILKYVKENFYDILDHINDDEFISNVANLGTDMNKMANDFFLMRIIINLRLKHKIYIKK